MEEQKTVAEHLIELRTRVLYYTLAFILFSVIGYMVNEQVISFLLTPLGEEVYYTSPTGGFDITLHISLLFGFLLSIPVLLINVYRFVEPALPGTTTKNLIALVLASVVLTVLGVLFAYYVGLPATLRFLMLFGSSEVSSLLSADLYFSFVTRYLLAFAVLFQLPVFMLVVNHVYRLKPRKLLRFQRYVVLGAFVLAAIITPTIDIVNQLLVALPIILLFYLSLLLIWLEPKVLDRRGTN